MSLNSEFRLDNKMYSVFHKLRNLKPGDYLEVVATDYIIEKVSSIMADGKTHFLVEAIDGLLIFTGVE